MKNLLPSLRESNRYIKFEIISKNQLKAKDIKKNLEKEILTFLGILELAKSSFSLINYKNNEGIIKVNRKYLNKIKGILPLINNEKILIKSKSVSGILKKIK
jgi:RNase P/RNase MRP subunit POP5